MNNTRNSSNRPPLKNTQSSISKSERNPSKEKRTKSPKKQKEKDKYKIDFIKKDNFDNFHNKINITEIN